MNNIMKFVVLVLIVSGCTKNENADELAIRKAVADYYDGIKAQDHSKMSDATFDFILYETGKVWNNDSVFNEMSKYKYSMNYSLTDFRITSDSDIAYANFHALVDFVFDDTLKKTFNFIENAAFVRKDGDWKITLLQVNEELPGYDTIQYAPDHYEARVSQFKSEDVKSGAIVLLGNSIIEYGNWKQLFGDSSVVNRGVAADNTFGVMRRLDEITGRRPSEVIIEIGINDVSQNIPVNMIADNITSIVNKLRSGLPNVKVYLVSLLPTNDDVRNEYPDAYLKNRLSGVVNAQLSLVAERYSFKYLDLNSRLSDREGKLDRRFASSDGLHLNKEGYGVFMRLLRER